MEFASIEREIHIEASPAVVYEVVSSPEHVREWWTDDARYEPVAGASGDITFGDPDDGGSVVSITIVDARPPELFSFRWTHPAGEQATPENSFLVTFTLTPTGAGTTLHMVETGFRTQGWEAAKVAAEHADHGQAWDHFLPQLVTRATAMATSR